MDLVTLAMAKKAATSGESVEISTNIDTDKDSNTKAASPKAVNDFVEGKGYLTQHQSLAEYAKTADVNTALSAKADTSTVNAALALKANSTDVTAQIAAAIGSVSSFEYYLCGEGEYDTQTGVPTVQNPDTEHIYLVPTSGTNLNMYAYIGSTFTFLGTTEVDLSAYAKTADVNTALAGKADTTDIPTVPTKISAFTNDVGFITKPQTTLFSITPEGEEVYPSIIGGVNNMVVYSREATTAEITALRAAAAVTETVYLNDLQTVLTEPEDTVLEPGEMCLAYNIKKTTTGAESGYDVADTSKPFYTINLGVEPEASTGFALVIASGETLKDVPLRMFSQGDYLTEHQSLAEYTKTSGFHQVAFSGNYNHLNNKPTIPTVPTISTNINSDAGSDAKTASPKAVKTFVEGKGYLTQHQSLANVNAVRVNGYKITVETEAPDAGTPDTTITIVVPE